MPKALEGVTIADFTQLMQGGFASQKLADFGADVIKIEPPQGEYLRSTPACGEMYEGESIKFLALNRNKRSLALDLKTEEGYQIAGEIIEDADVLMENFRSGTMAKLGLSYEEVQEINPNIVYVSGTGFGGDGPYADRPGQDLLIQAMAGLTTQTGEGDDPPTAAGTYVPDQNSANLLALHTVIALFHRERTGEGQRVEGSLLNSMIDGMNQTYSIYLNQDNEYERSEEGIANVSAPAPYGIYETSDGYVAISHTPLNVLDEVLDVDLSGYQTEKEAYDKRDEIKRVIEEQTRKDSSQEIVNKLREKDVWVGEVNTLREAATHPQVEHNDMIVEVEHPEVGEYKTPGIPVELSKTPGEVDAAPPLLGEHSEQILTELGYSSDTIAELVDEGVIVTPE